MIVLPKKKGKGPSKEDIEAVLPDLCLELASLFSASGNHSMIGRESEAEEIREFIHRCFQKESGLIYVCGKPGQGKTASINELIE